MSLGDFLFIKQVDIKIRVWFIGFTIEKALNDYIYSLINVEGTCLDTVNGHLSNIKRD